MSRRRKTSINGQFCWHGIAMLESPAWRALSLSGRRLLDRLEIEQSRHGGNAKANGKLICTFDDFERYGIDRHAIAPAIRETVALGFLEIVERGRAGNAEWRRPNTFRLTYQPTRTDEPSDDWRRIASAERAVQLARQARGAAAPKKQNPVGEKPAASGENPHRNHSGETPTRPKTQPIALGASRAG